MSNSLQAIRRHIDGSRVLNPVNLGRNFDNITNGLDSILRNGSQLQGIVQENRNLQQNIANITAERNQYQNLLNAENRQVRDLRHQLNDARAQVLRTDRMLTDALNDERNARRQNWDLAQNRLAELNNAQRERDEFRRN